MKFIIQPSGGGLGAKKIALVDVGGETYVAGGFGFGKYKVIGAFCDQYLSKVVDGKVVLLDSAGEISGTVLANTKIFAILGI